MCIDLFYCDCIVCIDFGMFVRERKNEQCQMLESIDEQRATRTCCLLFILLLAGDL